MNYQGVDQGRVKPLEARVVIFNEGPNLYIFGLKFVKNISIIKNPIV